MSNLLRSLRFFPLLITQFLGTLNDNLFKNALLTLVVLKMTAKSDILSNIIAGLFILPFFLFSAWAGEFADKYARDKIVRILKIIEIILMCGVGFAYFCNSITLLIVLIALIGTQSAFFGPIKYALLPQQLKPEELIEGNAYIEATTYMAILFGLILGTLLPISISIAVLIALAICGWQSSRLILPAPAPRPEAQINKNLLLSIRDNYHFLKKHHYIFQSILGATWFWIIGAFAAVQIYPLCGKILSAGNGTITFFLILFSVGVAVGSYCCNRLLRGVINMVYVPISAIGMAACLFILWWLTTDYPAPQNLMTFTEFLAAPRAFSISLSLFLLAFWGGLYIIPLNAFMQNRAPKAYTATVIAGNNIFNALGMASIAIFAIILLQFGFSLPQLFLIMGVSSFAIALYICILLPDNLTRSFLQTLLKLMFRTKLYGIENFYKAGKKVLIIANHVSLWDGILLAAFMPERITFAITSAWTGKWFMPIIRLLVDFYPVDPENPLSIRKLIGQIQNGKKVMIFPEGRITLTGKIMQVYDGAAMVAAKSGAKILPIRIEGAQYSTMSYVQDKLHCKIFPQINLTVLPAKKIDTNILQKGCDTAQQHLYKIMTEMTFHATRIPDGFYEALQKSIQLHGKNKKIARTLDGSALTAAQLLRHGVMLAKSLQTRLSKKNKIALLISNPITFLTAFTALDYLHKTIILPQDNNLPEDVDFIIHDKENADFTTDCASLLKLKFNIFNIFCRKKINHGQTFVIFYNNGKKVESSISELLENYAKLDCVLPFTPKDKVLNPMSVYCAKNFVLGVLLPILSGCETLFYTGKHIKLIPHLCYDFASTILFANKLILQTALNEASPFDFFNIKMAFAISDKLDNKLLEDYLKQFNIRILENYTPENLPIIQAINTPLYNRFGSFGQLLPDTHITNDDTILSDNDGFYFPKS